MKRKTFIKLLSIALPFYFVSGCAYIYDSRTGERMVCTKDIQPGETGESIFYKNGFKYYLVTDYGSTNTVPYSIVKNGDLRKEYPLFATIREDKYYEIVDEIEAETKASAEKQLKEMEYRQLEERYQLTQDKIAEFEKFSHTEKEEVFQEMFLSLSLSMSMYEAKNGEGTYVGSEQMIKDIDEIIEDAKAGKYDGSTLKQLPK